MIKMSQNGTVRLAIPSAAPGGLKANRSGHFGRCDCFTVVDIKDGKQEGVSIIQTPPHVEGGCMGPVNLLASNNVNAIAVGGIGMRPLLGFRSVGIDVLIGEGNQVEETVSAYLHGNLRPISDEDTCGGH
jgi:predicted Fe-Mo cluster-binding NifX family protein